MRGVLTEIQYWLPFLQLTASGLILTSRLLEDFQFPDFPQRINRQNRNMAVVPPAPAADSWVGNSNVGNFNPGTKTRHHM